MLQYLQLVKRTLLLATPAIASLMLVASPTKAATFATSQGQSLFANFSQDPFSTETITDTQTIAISTGGSAAALNDAEALFLVNPPVGSSLSSSRALGNNKNYFALAESTTVVHGSFNVEAGTLFSFDFITSLDLETSIDIPIQEIAISAGKASFVLFDVVHENSLEFFNIFGNLKSFDDTDFLSIEKSENVTLLEPGSLFQQSFGGNQEFATAFVQGRVEHKVEKNTVLALIEIRKNQAIVQSPEPSSILALLVYSAILGISLKKRHKEKIVTKEG